MGSVLHIVRGVCPADRVREYYGEDEAHFAPNSWSRELSGVFRVRPDTDYRERAG